jgi:hypothetical protein
MNCSNNKAFLDELISTSNSLRLKKNMKDLNISQTVKAERKRKQYEEYINLNNQDYEILNKVYRQNCIIENNTEILKTAESKNNDGLVTIYKIVDSNYNNILRNTKGLFYLGGFVVLSQIIITAINDYLMLSVFN